MLTDLGTQIRSLLDLRVDTDYKNTDESIRQNVRFKSANAWTLVFAIFIASVGLNVNSTAVIIGAMLISPLMGPIVGAGYALGINDFELLKSSGRNLLYAVCISLVTSTIFFLLTPFKEVQGELLARTTPNFYDVVVAFFGGAAGIVAMSRSEKSNAVPGVAIATALMPPLCTAGFGIATLEWKYFIGAFYLFVINSVFICLSTCIFVRSLHFKKTKSDDVSEQKKIKRWIVFIATGVTIPSLFTAWLLLGQSAFKHKANKFVDEAIVFKGTILVDKKINYELKDKRIDLTFIGAKLGEGKIRELNAQKDLYGLSDVTLGIHQVAIDEHVDAKLGQINKRELLFNNRIADLELELKKYQNELSLEAALMTELRVFISGINALELKNDAVKVVWQKKPQSKEKKMVEEFLVNRMNNIHLKFLHALVI